jgi:hypothetical protein
MVLICSVSSFIPFLVASTVGFFPANPPSLPLSYQARKAIERAMSHFFVDCGGTGGIPLVRRQGNSFPRAVLLQRRHTRLQRSKSVGARHLREGERSRGKRKRRIQTMDLVEMFEWCRIRRDVASSSRGKPWLSCFSHALSLYREMLTMSRVSSGNGV